MLSFFEKENPNLKKISVMIKKNKKKTDDDHRL